MNALIWFLSGFVTLFSLAGGVVAKEDPSNKYAVVAGPLLGLGWLITLIVLVTLWWVGK